MPIRRYLPECAVFEPETIASMSEALDEACIALHVSSGDIQGRLTVSTRIIDLARAGIIDAQALRERVVAESQAVAAVYLDRSERSPRHPTTQSHPA